MICHKRLLERWVRLEECPYVTVGGGLLPVVVNAYVCASCNNAQSHANDHMQPVACLYESDCPVSANRPLLVVFLPLSSHLLHFSPCPTPFNPLLISSLADLVCETAGELVDGTGFYDSRESGASADLVAWLAGTEWGPQQHKKAGVSEGREVGE